MKGTIFTTVLIYSAILTACSPAAPREAMALTQSPSPSPTEEPADETSDEAYHKITTEEAKQMMDEGNATIVGMRTAEKYAAGYTPGSILISVESIGDMKPVELPDTEVVLLVHCRTDIYSKRASDQLVELGYKHAYDFDGIVDWPYETVAEN